MKTKTVVVKHADYFANYTEDYYPSMQLRWIEVDSKITLCQKYDSSIFINPVETSVIWVEVEHEQ